MAVDWFIDTDTSRYDHRNLQVTNVLKTTSVRTEHAANVDDGRAAGPRTKPPVRVHSPNRRHCRDTRPCPLVDDFRCVTCGRSVKRSRLGENTPKQMIPDGNVDTNRTADRQTNTTERCEDPFFSER